MKTIYLDNAATSFPKPPQVIEAVADAMRERGGNPGRSSHALAAAAADAVFEGREAVASLFGGRAENVVFTMNATYALNLAIKGLVPDHSHVLLSDMEHNSVRRPVAALAARGVTYDHYRSLGRSEKDVESVLYSLREKLRPETSAIIACHRSNVLPIELPLKAMGEFAAEKGLLFIVDASQSAGSCEIDLEDCRISALCAPGHKGLFGPQGSGFVLFGEGVKERLPAPLLEGGSGSDSISISMPDLLPERLEAGTLPVETIAGLAAGISFIQKEGLGKIAEREGTLAGLLKKRLSAIPGVHLYLPERQVGSIVLFNLNGHSSAEVAAALDAEGICIRAGLHCSPLAHRLAGTLSGGALRASVGYFNTEEDVIALSLAVKRLAWR